MKQVWNIALWGVLIGCAGILFVLSAHAQNKITDVRLIASTDLTEIERQLAAAPEDHRLRRQYADVLFEQKRFRDAAKQYEVFLQHFQGAPDTVHRYLISIAGYAGDNAKGERAVQRYLEYYPTDYELYMRLGYFQLWQSKFEEAKAAFERALRLNPDHAPTQQGLVEAEAGLVLINRLQNPPPEKVSDPSQYPQLDEKRFRFIRDLMNYRRYFAAYEQLMLLARRHDESQRWLDLYAEIDAALRLTQGYSPAYPIERYSYLLEHQPGNITLRYALVDELIARDRIEEAYTALLKLDLVNPLDPGYVERVHLLDEKRLRGFQGRIEQQESLLEKDPGNISLMAELIGLYQISRRAEDALPLYERWLDLRPSADSVRTQYARLLLDIGRMAEGLEESERLLERSPSLDAVRLYARAVLATQSNTDEAQARLEQLAEQQPENVDILLDLSEIYLAKDDPQTADVYLRKAFTLGLPSDRDRLLFLDRRIERSLQKKKRERQAEMLADARALARQERYEAAISRYDYYFAQQGTWTRPILQELAQVYSLSGDYVQAISILDALQEKSYSPAIAREIARNRYYLEDHAGAIMVLEELLARHPRDVESRDLLQQVYLETQRYAQADTVYYERVHQVAENTRLKASYAQLYNEQIRLVERAIDTDFVGLIVPVSAYTRAEGSITSYEHWAQGLLTQVTLPAEPRPFMITAGLVSHYLQGTRRLLLDTPHALTRVNQVTLGSYFDLTAPDFKTRLAYTNRIWMQFGVFDYAGTRTMGYADVRYLKQKPGRYALSLGARSTEGALALWSPAGGEFGLRMIQFDVKGRSSSILPDSTLRVRGSLALNVVKGRSDSTLAGIGRNVGTDLKLEVSYRVLRNTYLGLAFGNIDYRHTLDTYFSPSNYRSYDVWAEYEREIFGSLFWRTRGTAGLVSYRRGAFAARLESDLIYRFHPHLSFNLSGSAGYSIRFLDGQGSLRDERFRMILFSGAFYWTL